MNEKTVEQFMTEMTTIDKDAKVSQAYKQFKKGKNTHLIVTDEKSEEPIGIISRKDLLWNLWDEAKEGKVPKLYVSSIVTRNLITIDANESINYAMKRMIEENISSLPVKSDGKIRNLLTKRDLLKNITEFPRQEIQNLMTEEVIFAHEGTRITRAIDIMKRRGISMLPIVEKGELTGFCDIHGLAREMIELFINPPYRHIDSALKKIRLSDVMMGAIGLLPDTSIYKFAEEVIRKEVKGMPIIASENSQEVAGILSETDVCQYVAHL